MMGLRLLRFVCIVGVGGVFVAGCGAVGSSLVPPSGAVSSPGTIVSSAVTTAAAAAAAATSGPAPGQWQLVIEVDDMPGAGRVPPQTMSMCSTAEDKRQWQNMVGGKATAGCNVRNYSANGATISYVMQCGNGIEGAATITIVDDDNYRGESTLTLRSGLQAAVIKSRMTGKRVAKTCAK